jgi:phage terminase large subunit
LQLAKRIEALEAKITIEGGTGERTRFGIVSSDKSVIRVIQDQGEWVEVNEPPDVYIPEKLEPVLTRPKRFITVIGGRGSGKSQNIASIESARMRDYGIKLACFREFQNSIEDSVYSLIENQIRAINMEGFDFVQGAIRHNGGGQAKFRGLARNPDSIKSMDGFRDFWTEEAQAASEKSLKLLTPTMRSDGGRMIFTANPGSSEDPFSKRFINPFMAELLRSGIYEDDLHLVIMMNWKDNPWFPKELEDERLWDLENLPRALYDHVWEGEFNDSVDDALVMSEWFDACIDAHKKLGFEAVGVKLAAHDPSDMGGDSKGYCLRHGSVILDVQENTHGTVNEGGDWATGLAIQHGVNAFTWDADGMGIALARQIDTALEGKNIRAVMFKGSESPDFPEAIYEPSYRSGIIEQKTNKDTFRNKRAQYYFMLRDRVYRTYRAVVHGEYTDPEKMISFSSDIESIHKLRAELCRMPVKPNSNGLFELYTKPEMKSKFKLSSPNLADSVMMALRFINVQHQAAARRPAPIRRMGK